MNPNNAQDELRGLNSSLPAGNNPYTVPEGYFAGLADSVLAKIKEQSEPASIEIAQLSPLLAGISRRMPYSLPENFFESSLAELPVLITDKEESPVLSYIGKSMPYFLPEGYFESLPAQIVTRLTGSGTKVIPMVKRKWMRIAVAAVVFGMISISGLFYFISKKDHTQDPIAQIKSVSTRDIDNFLKNTDVSATNSITAQSTSRTNEIKNMLQDVPDNELDSFLNQVPSDDE